VRWDGGEHAWRFGGEVSPDACERIGTLQVIVPDATGELVLDLALSGPVTASNRYMTNIRKA
jgi:hypothetical protein